MKNRWTLFMTLGLTTALSCSLYAQGTFTRLGVHDTRPTGISGDGQIVVGSYTIGHGAWRWTEAEGFQPLGGAGNGTEARISRDGKTIVYNSADRQGLISAAIWLGVRDWRTLGGLPGAAPGGADNSTLSTVYGVSGDGSVIVGLAWIGQTARAFRWTEETGMVNLGSMKGESSRANLVTPDGHMIAGWDSPVQYSAPGRAGVMWWDGMERPIHPMGWAGEVLGSNEAGTVLVGTGSPVSMTSGGGFAHAYRWTAGEGFFLDLGALVESVRPGDSAANYPSWGLAVSDNGSVVVGTSGFPPVQAFYWTAETGMIRFADFLRSKGITGWEGWSFFEAVTMSPDGKVIGGSGATPEGQLEGFIVRLQ